MRAALAILVLIAGLSTAYAFGLGKGDRFGKLGAVGKKATAAAPVSCVSPTAPNGVVDLSQCSNAFYAAVIF